MKYGERGKGPVTTRVLRGGDWDYAICNLRASNRVHDFPHGVYPVGGFRCAQNVD